MRCKKNADQPRKVSQLLADSRLAFIQGKYEENKWIMLDPSYNLFFRDNKGRLLSISEYKKYLAYKKTEIIIGENANYKCEPLDIRKYENPMIKNCID